MVQFESFLIKYYGHIISFFLSKIDNFQLRFSILVIWRLVQQWTELYSCFKGYCCTKDLLEIKCIVPLTHRISIISPRGPFHLTILDIKREVLNRYFAGGFKHTVGQPNNLK